MKRPDIQAPLGTRHRTKTKQKTQRRKLTRCVTRTPPKIWSRIEMLAKGKEFLLLIRHPPLYSLSTHMGGIRKK